MNQNESPVRVWEGKLTIPTYRLGPDDQNPPILIERRNPIHPGSSIMYPYPIQEWLTGIKEERVWRAVLLENDYLRHADEQNLIDNSDREGDNLYLENLLHNEPHLFEEGDRLRSRFCMPAMQQECLVPISWDATGSTRKRDHACSRIQRDSAGIPHTHA